MTTSIAVLFHGAGGTASVAVLSHKTSRLARVALRQPSCSVTTRHKRRGWQSVSRRALSQHVTTGAGDTTSIAVPCHNMCSDAQVALRQSPCSVTTRHKRRG